MGVQLFNFEVQLTVEKRIISSQANCKKGLTWLFFHWIWLSADHLRLEYAVIAPILQMTMTLDWTGRGQEIELGLILGEDNRQELLW